MINELCSTLSKPLPGARAQMKMAPPTRRYYTSPIPPTARKSAVMALIYPYQYREDYHIVFMKRAEDGRAHGGQISFPGGKWEDTDRDLIHTALRETEEEIGVPQEEIDILGNLTKLYIPVSNYLVYPTVGFVDKRPSFIPDPVEVAEIIEVPVATLLAKHSSGIHPVHVRGAQFEAPAYKIGHYTIWGATAMMVAELSEVLKHISSY